MHYSLNYYYLQGLGLQVTEAGRALWTKARFRVTIWREISRDKIFREKIFSLFDDRKATLTGCMLTTPTSRDKVQWWREMFSLETMVCVCHIYEDIWDATVAEEQPCQIELDIINRHRHWATACIAPLPSPTDSSARSSLPHQPKQWRTTILS